MTRRYIIKLIGILKSPTEKKYLLDVAKANASRILGVQNLELPASLKELEGDDKRRSSSDKEERVRADLAPQKTPAQVSLKHMTADVLLTHTQCLLELLCCMNVPSG